MPHGKHLFWIAAIAYGMIAITRSVEARSLFIPGYGAL